MIDVLLNVLQIASVVLALWGAAVLLRKRK